MNTITFIFCLICTWFILKPHLATVHGPIVDASKEIEALEEQKHHCLQVLRDLEMDLKTGKIQEADYKQMKDSISLELAEILENLDKKNA